MRVAVRERLTAGDSDDGRMDYMVARYGDYVLLEPPFKPRTLLLWLGAPLVLLVAAAALLFAARRRRRCEPPALLERRGERALDRILRDASLRLRLRMRNARRPHLRRAAGPVSKGGARLTPMLEFLLALLTTATVGVLLVPLLRTARRRDDRLDNDLAIYRDQLAELERERGGGRAARGGRPRRPHRDRAPHPRRRRAGCKAGPRRRRRRVMAPLPAARPLPRGAAVRARPLPADRPSRPSRRALRRPPHRPAARAAAAATTSPTRSPPPRARRPSIPTTPTLCRRWARRSPWKPTASSPRPPSRPSPRRWTRTRRSARAFYLGLHEPQSGDPRPRSKRWRELEAAIAARRAVAADAARRDASASRARPGAAPPPAPRRVRRRSGPTRTRSRRCRASRPSERQQAIRGMVEGLDAQACATAGRPRRLAAAGQRAQGAGRERQGGRGLRQGRRDRRRSTPASSPTGPRRMSARSRPAARRRPRPSRCWSGWRRPSPATRWRCSISAPRPSPQGDKPAAARRWKTLLALLPADAPIRAMLEGKIKEASGGGVGSSDPRDGNGREGRRFLPRDQIEVGPRTAMQVKAGQHGDPVAFHHVEQAVREAAQHGAANAIVQQLILGRIVSQKVFDPSDLVHEATAKPGALLRDTR